VQNDVSEEDNADFIGQRVQVLVEGLSKWGRGSKGENSKSLESLRAGVDEKTNAQTEVLDSLPGWHAGAESVNDPQSYEAPDDLVSLDAKSTKTFSSEQSQKVAVSESAVGAVGPVQLVGRTMCDRIVVFTGNPRLAGTLAEIEIDDVTPTTLMGSIVTQEVQSGTTALLPILG
jgi:tRNA-2-methylthio-N6-dimethylallyladenosine synthase